MTAADQPAPSAATEATTASRIAEIRGRHDACIVSGDDLCDVPYLLAHIDRLRVTHAEFARFVQEAQEMRAEGMEARAALVRMSEIALQFKSERDALRAELTASQSREAAVKAASDAWWAWKRASLYDAGPDGQLWKNVNVTQMALADLLAAPDRADQEGTDVRS